MLSKKEFAVKLDEQRKAAEENDAKRRAEKLSLPYLDLISIKVPTEIKAMQLVPEAEARAALLVPLQLMRKKLIIAIFDPSQPAAKAICERLSKTYTLEIVVSSLNGLHHAWSYYKYVVSETAEISGKIDINQKNLENIRVNIKTIEDLATAITNFKSTVVSQILEIILAGSLALDASDIHLEPTADAGTIRFRIDGLLHAVTQTLSPVIYHSVVTRIKLLSNLKLNIHNEPQDGRFTIGLSDHNIEIRTSIIPSEYGETVVMRILDPTALKANLEELGWRSDDLAIIMQEIKKPNGIILNTGPTGSGKTTTLYAFLQYMWKPEIKIITVEDPVEYHLKGISQTQVNTDAHYTFASGLRSILRQDPNIILVGEIRDKETAEIATQAALTGHIVFSTLHTNDAVGAIPRFIDLGVPPQILGPALTLVIAQRLVRQLCEACKIPITLSQELKERIEKFLHNLPKRIDHTLYTNPTIYSPKGCSLCGGIGYKNRISVFELFQITEPIEALIYTNPTEIELAKLARAQGMVSLQEDGILKVLRGITSTAEVERITGSINWLPQNTT